MPAQKYLIVIGGPTASGKTELALALANRLGTEILSCDSRQFYREMSIGTAKPSPAELRQAPHHFIDNLSIADPYSVGDFARDALAKLTDLFRENDFVVMVGGSGLYIRAVCAGLDAFPEVPLPVRREVEALYQQEGLPALQAELRRVDPAYYEEVDLQNPHRLIRALAVWRASGRPFSSFRQARPQPRPFTPVYLALHLPRPVLYERIDRRVTQMMEQGLLEEARRLHPRRGLTALETVGYQELFDHFEGKHTLEEAVALIQRNSRRYAKRQLTWLRRDGHWKHLRPGETDLALRYIEIVKTQGLHLQHVPPKALPPSLLPAPPHEAQAHYFVLTGQSHLALPYRNDKEPAWLWPPRTAGPEAPHDALALLLHEAGLTAGESLYAVFPEAIEPSYRDAGFVTIARHLLPPGLQRNLAALPSGWLTGKKR